MTYRISQEDLLATKQGKKWLYAAPQRIYITPMGTYPSSVYAQDALATSRQTIVKRCLSTDPKWVWWSYLEGDQITDKARKQAEADVNRYAKNDYAITRDFEICPPEFKTTRYKSELFIKKAVNTPFGIFTNTLEAAKVADIHFDTVRRRCRSKLPQFKDWYYFEKIK